MVTAAQMNEIIAQISSNLTKALSDDIRRNLNKALEERDKNVLDGLRKAITDGNTQVLSIIRKEIQIGNSSVMGYLSEQIVTAKMDLARSIESVGVHLSVELAAALRSDVSEAMQDFTRDLSKVEKRLGRGELADGSSSFKEITAAVKELTAQMAEIRAEDRSKPFAQLKSHVETVQKTSEVSDDSSALLVCVKEMFQQLSTKIDGNQEFLGKLENKITSLSSKVDLVVQSQTALGRGIESLAASLSLVSGDVADVLTNQAEFKEQLTKTLGKVNEISLLTLATSGSFNVPRLVTMDPIKFDVASTPTSSPEQVSAKGFLAKISRVISKSTNTIETGVKKLKYKFGVRNYFKLVLLCDGRSCKSDDVPVMPCSNPHEGYEFETDGPVIEKLAVVISATNKILGAASVILKIAGALNGIPFPALRIPIGNTLPSDLLHQTSEFLDSQNENISKLFDKLESGGGSDVKPATDDEHLNKLTEEGYRQLKDLLEGSSCTWTTDKPTFYIQRYRVDGTVKWLCENHKGKNAQKWTGY
jgi:hypothetical protein